MSMLLEVKDLRVSFKTYMGVVRALRGVSFSVDRRQSIAIVGESGCGKSVLAQSLMKLIVTPPGVIESGQVLLEGDDLLCKSNKEIERIRGKEIGMIFQDPMTSLNPTMRIGKQIMEGLRKHLRMSRDKAFARAVEMLELVGISNPTRRALQYPHELSGGMRQRVIIAIALALEPKVLIADEPTTALDVTIQAQILELMKKIQKRMDTSIIFITHDLGVVANLCDQVMVMYAGKIVEKGSVRQIYHHPAHPYTRGLLKSCPRLDMDTKERLLPIEGSPPNLLHIPSGCAFCPRCSEAMRICANREPKTFQVSLSHKVDCWKHANQETI